MKHDFETREEAAEDEWPECKLCHVRRWHVDENSECKGGAKQSEIANQTSEPPNY